MATSSAHRDHDRHAARPRPSHSTLQAAASPRSPRTPQLGRSVSSQFGSPGSFRSEQEDVIVYELGPRHFSAGFAGESRPRCILPFSPETSQRVGDYRQYEPGHAANMRPFRLREEWAASHELYHADLREDDLGLVEDKLDRALRTAHIDYLQLDSKPRKAALVMPSLLPTPLLETVLKVLFGHYTQPPSVSLITQPVMCCVSAGLRNGIVVDIGWEETTVTAVGEYKEVAQRRSVRAGKSLTREMGNIIEGSVPSEDEVKATFAEAEDITQRMAWCQRRTPPSDQEATVVQLPVPGSTSNETFSILFDKLAEPAERVFFASDSKPDEHDDHDSPLHILAYRVLLALPTDFRAICVSRIMVTGIYGGLPGLKRRVLQEIEHLISLRGWDPVSNYGSAKDHGALEERSTNTLHLTPPGASSPTVPLSPLKMPLQEAIPHRDRVHDDIKDPITNKAERAQAQGRADPPVKGIVRGVETLGAWAGASLMASMRVKGAHEVERDEFVKFGLKDQGDRL
ncbi:putative Actin family, ATPase, nucleotide binding domain-containing protein [Septoria linicola]|nr:putative Actin family, ATPase, nucleotide binding domain-containing protein [Septoria linicola]